MYTLQGKTRPIWHVRYPRQSTYARHTIPVGSSHMWQPFTKSSTAMDRATALKKKGSRHNPQRQLTDPQVHTQFVSRASHWSSGGKATLCRQLATRHTGLISPVCDRYVQYLLVGANPSVLNRHRRGLQPWRCQLSTYHSLTFPISYLHFPLMAPPSLQFNQGPSTKPKCWMWRTYGHHVVFWPSGHLP
jgi:hypothetical protein